VALAVLICTLLAAAATVHTTINVRLLRRPSGAPGAPPPGTVAVLLPLRDEAHRVEPCLRSLLAQRGVAFELIVFDDGSTDGTADVVRAVAPAARLISGAGPPPGWLGKPHACHRLAGATTADVLVFVDADVVLAPEAVAACATLVDGFDLVSPYPRIVAEGLGPRLVQPLLQWSWLTFLPLRVMERSPRPALAAAGGQLLVVRRTGYERAGGHAAVRDQVLDDVALARAVKRTGGRIALADGSRLATCRMYRSWRELVDGYTKSLWAAFGSPLGAGCIVGLLLALYVVPVLAAALGWLAGGSVAVAGLAGYLLAAAGRVVAARATGGRTWPDALGHPVSVVLFGWLVVRSYRRRRRGGLRWKGRRVDIRKRPNEISGEP